MAEVAASCWLLTPRKRTCMRWLSEEVYVDLPTEQRVPGMCARLNRCLYGTRDAPARWEDFLATQLKAMGFDRGLASPCCYQHSYRDLLCIVHGNDFVFVGPGRELRRVQIR